MVDFTVCGTLDLHKKSEDLEESSTKPKYLWWHIYLINIPDIEILIKSFVIIDNLDAKTEWLVVRDMSHFACTVVDEEKELTQELSHKPHLYITKEDERLYTIEQLNALNKICKQVYPCVGIYPKLLVCECDYDMTIDTILAKLNIVTDATYE
jgi:hypothetical protein